MIDKQSQGKIKSIQTDERFDSLVALAEELKNKWNADKSKRDTEFDTIWELAYLSGKVDGLDDFFKNINQYA
jgi:hypothetical protein